jgi:hypothetical protein
MQESWLGGFVAGLDAKTCCAIVKDANLTHIVVVAHVEKWGKSNRYESNALARHDLAQELLVDISHSSWLWYLYVNILCFLTCLIRGEDKIRDEARDVLAKSFRKCLEDNACRPRRSLERAVGCAQLYAQPDVAEAAAKDPTDIEPLREFLLRAGARHGCHFTVRCRRVGGSVTGDSIRVVGDKLEIGGSAVDCGTIDCVFFSSTNQGCEACGAISWDRDQLKWEGCTYTCFGACCMPGPELREIDAQNIVNNVRKVAR